MAADDVIKRGTQAEGKLEQALSSASAHEGDHFVLVLKSGWFFNKNLKNVKLEGHLEEVHPAAKFGKKGSLKLVFDDLLTADGQALPVQAHLVSTGATKAKGHMLRNAALIIGGAVAGHHVASKMGKQHGGLMGAATATAVVIAMPGSDIQLAKGTTLKVKFDEEVALSH
jgi:hypothetical protein